MALPIREYIRWKTTDPTNVKIAMTTITIIEIIKAYSTSPCPGSRKRVQANLRVLTALTLSPPLRATNTTSNNAEHFVYYFEYLYYIGAFDPLQ